ncbi:PfkB family carbohydrate kinase [Arthrobacter sp. B0490]|uniref:PfkB family carbohydrate kinase n=1 Tax=Arthrobacter sp. B0490 TaxID=2058891 RepID=UPI000CE3BF7A|nr:PfkB family carbohydrate kinase [Arthrobacter sp. B0490]
MTSQTTRSVVVIGDALIDELREPTGSQSFPGGAALNVAVGLTLLGVPATLIAMVGDDVDGRRIKDFLKQHNVELLATPAPYGTARATSDRTHGEPRYVFNQAAQHRTLVFQGAHRAAVAQAALVAVSCFPFDNQVEVDSLTALIGQPERRLVIDPNPRSGMLVNRELFLTNFTHLAARSLLSKVGDDDARLLADEDLHAFSRRLLEAGASTILATAGPKGASILRASHPEVHQPIAELPGPIVDTMGAGDATLSSILSTLTRHGMPDTPAAINTALTEAMLIAAATCRTHGALLQRPATLAAHSASASVNAATADI